MGGCYKKILHTLKTHPFLPRKGQSTNNCLGPGAGHLTRDWWHPYKGTSLGNCWSLLCALHLFQTHCCSFSSTDWKIKNAQQMWDPLEHISEWGVAPKEDEQQTNRVGCDWGFVFLSESPNSLFTPNLEIKIKRGHLKKKKMQSTIA